MPHAPVSSCVVSSSCPEALWQSLAQQLRRRHLPLPLQPERDDIVSESLLRAFTSPPPDGHWGAWVNRIFSNVALDRLRGISRASRAHAGLALMPCPPAPSPEDTVVTCEERRALSIALQSLPAPLNQAVHERFFSDGDKQAKPLSTARVHVHRGIARLRLTLASLRGIFLPIYAPMATATMGAALFAHVALPTKPLRIAQNPDTQPAAAPAMMHVTSRPRVISVAADQPRKPAPPANAQAQTPSADAPPARVFDFDEDFVEGELTAANVMLVQGAVASKQESLLEIPATMLGPLLKSLEDI